MTVPARAAAATWARLTRRPGDPRTAKAASRSSTSPGAASSSVAAMRVAFRRTARAASSAALPASAALRLPEVPTPSGMCAVSPVMTAIVPAARPSSAAAMAASSVSWLWPCGAAPMASARSRRVSIHFTGRPRRAAASGTSTSSGNTGPFDPNAPPTSCGAMTRTPSSRSPSWATISRR